MGRASWGTLPPNLCGRVPKCESVEGAHEVMGGGGALRALDRSRDMADLKKLLTIEEACERLGIHASTFYRGVAAKRYPKPMELGPGIRRVHPEDIDALIEGARAHAAGKAA